jgi:glycerol-3-phosphate dehydrogenase
VVRALVDAGAARVLAVVRREARPTSEHLRWVSADLRQVAEVQALAGNGVDVIVHAAAVLPKTLDDHSAADSNRAMDRNILSLADAMGADRQTLAGLSGLGDLAMTASCDNSRNRTVGLRLGRGEKLSEIVASLGSVAEGVSSTPLVMKLADQYAVEMPITAHVAKLLGGEMSPLDLVRSLIARPVRREF